ncbi:LysR family transcriptional regulator [Paraburkholderia caballeronis]|uniref:DNA-binding transcriptional regulator, LysR family n=1 Tax=Paraburkholderia caballeronis TaxID=416943 RepID=A0A1H7G1E4_9BURK|nr:LysR family transcriptional regulator [Paraburkholderia caballeronis]PXW24754.1 DNA-binding transcriptional LysR family regulator [Paraburkholderia caballeronis]PXX00484.1 DNA-binding transcriptional LysR family regulator [Paraburkholderia caballeronis]RAJ98547.1 DNA-binding transcriptional LysR family regulator [Paraburkholderia caballeronis]SEE66551.1 DNA-binding transcriptional regulator, LysR family [Paraburkholderia caballeronis]SEK31931.1 DNA-binding transcriptional regulator, LysR fa
MNLSLKQLKVFLGVANASSFTKTAQSMHLSQAALSAIIRELETQLQCRLLERTTRTVSLTEAGRVFYPTAMKIVETLEKSVIELNELGRQKQSSLLLGCTPMIAASLMPPVLSRFSKVYPHAQIELVDRAPGELLQMVEEGHLDAAFGVFFSQLSGIDRVPIFPTHLVAVSALDDDGPDRRGGNGIRWTALEGRPLITLPKDNPLQRLIEATLSKEEVNVSRRIVVGHLQTAVAMAQEGLGTAVMPSFCRHICSRYRVRIDMIRPEVALSFYRITRVGRDTLAVLDQFTEMFTETAQEDPAPIIADELD